MLLDRKVVVVTGAGGGIGEAIARVCYREGAAVVVADIRGDAARTVAGSFGERGLAVNCDVSNDEDLHELVGAAVGRFGRIDGLVNNAGVDFSRPFLQTTAEDWAKVTGVDLRAVFFLTQMVCRQMLSQERPGGSVVNIASVHSTAGFPGAGPYDASKWGVVGMGKSIAVEMAAKGIRVNAVSPGLVNTGIWEATLQRSPDRAKVEAYSARNIPTGKVIEPGEIAEVVAFLLSDRASCVTGANVIADGGMTALLVPKME